MNPESWTKNFRGFIMSIKYKKHSIEDRIKYMKMLEEGRSIRSISVKYGINHGLLSVLWTKYQNEGVLGLKKQSLVSADGAFKVSVVRDVEEKCIPLSEVAIKYNVSISAINSWIRIVREKGYGALYDIRKRGRPPKDTNMGRPRKKKPEEMTELELLRYENERLRAEVALLKKVRALVEEREARLRATGRKPSKN